MNNMNKQKLSGVRSLISAIKWYPSAKEYDHGKAAQHTHHQLSLHYLQNYDDWVAHVEGAEGDDNTSPLIGSEIVPRYGPSLSNQQKNEHLPRLVHCALRLEFSMRNQSALIHQPFTFIRWSEMDEFSAICQLVTVFLDAADSKC